MNVKEFLQENNKPKIDKKADTFLYPPSYRFVDVSILSIVSFYISLNKLTCLSSVGLSSYLDNRNNIYSKCLISLKSPYYIRISLSAYLFLCPLYIWSVWILCIVYKIILCICYLLPGNLCSSAAYRSYITLLYTCLRYDCLECWPVTPALSTTICLFVCTDSYLESLVVDCLTNLCVVDLNAGLCCSLCCV